MRINENDKDEINNPTFWYSIAKDLYDKLHTDELSIVMAFALEIRNQYSKGVQHGRWKANNDPS